MRVVLDTNVFVSALFWRGNPYRVLRKCLKKEIHLIVSEEILQEVRKILTEETKFELTLEDIEIYDRILRGNAEIVNPNQKLEVIEEDSTDNKFLECAIEGRATYIVSGDRHLLDLKEYKGVKILSPAKFLTIFLEFSHALK